MGALQKLFAISDRKEPSLTPPDAAELMTGPYSASHVFSRTLITSTHDFIIVGGGTAGCLLANRLAHSAARPSVLLIEAGTDPSGDEILNPFNRFAVPIIRPDLDYAYTSTPQKNLDGRTIVYERGKGLGGSTLLNYGVYLYGSREDYNRWADIVGDETWRWEHTKESFKQIENYDFSANSAYSQYANPKPVDHGKHGYVKIRLPPVFEKGYAEVLKAFLDTGESLNLDVNSGNPMGVGVWPISSFGDGRTTSATAHLVDRPSNLIVWTDAIVHRLKIDEGRVTGIETADGLATCLKEVILCAGSIDTPRILLLNGIGPAAELEAHGIQVIKDLPGVGKNLADHVVAWLSCEVDGSMNDRYAFEIDAARMVEAKAQWAKDKSGTFAFHYGMLWGAFLKLPSLHDYAEFQALEREQQEFLSRGTVPTYEMSGSPCMWPPDAVLAKGNTYLSANVFLMNPMSRGSITLRSCNPQDPPIIDLAFLDHPYDRRVLRESYRETWKKFYENPFVQPKIQRRLFGAKSLSDADINEFLRENTTSVRHVNGTAKMGRTGDPLSCVDSNFKVYGVGGLRVADLSVCPVIPSNHTQTTAYLVGQKAADKLIAEYHLNEGRTA
ncbi:hypothetical protein N0V90_003859 [Kalmusia sp. IMI 367209]|nr:hypothetical protein N0V90_003859 [Kalmusia sp. IMI 367209]